MPYPGYEDMNGMGTGSHRLEEQGLKEVHTFPAGIEKPPRRVAKATVLARAVSTAVGSSLDKMEAPFLFGENDHQISDNSDDDMDYERDPYSWNNTSLASSAFFQDGGEGRSGEDPARVKPPAEKHVVRLGGSDPSGSEKTPGNAIERLIREKAGKDSAKKRQVRQWQILWQTC